MQGRVKWLDPIKGYGFVEYDNKDYFLHASVISEQSQSIAANDIIEFEAVDAKNGPRVTKIISVTKQNKNPDKVKGIATIKFASRDYAFLVIDGEDIFVGKKFLAHIDKNDRGARLFVGATRKEKGLVADSLRWI